MTGPLPTIPVLAAPAIDPASARIELTLPEGLTMAEIVTAALPAATDADLDRARVSLVTPTGSSIVPRAHWHRIRPKPGVQVVIRLVPGKNALKQILSIVISIAALVFAPYLGGLLAGTLGLGAATWTALAAVGINLLGNLLINALIPPVEPEKERQSFSISGWRNRIDPDGAIPVLLGRVRYAPPFAARSWTEIAGDNQYVHALFTFGEGPLDLTDFRIGETSIAEYDEVDLEVRQGYVDDDPVSLYPNQIVEEQIGVELTRLLLRDDAGEVIKGEGAGIIEAPVVRTTGPDASAASILLGFPSGLVRFNDDGEKRSHPVSIRVEQRQIGAEEWAEVTTLDLSARKAEPFFRQHSWTFPERARWQIRLTLLTDETENTKVQQRVAWAALQTIRPEYPLNYHRPLSLVAVRVKATYQLSGALDNFSALGSRICLDWDHETETWVERSTTNPASLFRFVLQCPANPKPVADAAIDLDLLADWHDFCRLKGLHYNRVQEQAGTTLRDALTEIAVAGRAAPRHDGVKWGVVIDRPAELVVDHVSPRNSWNFSLRRAYAEKPHAWIARFQDEGNDYKPAERVIRRPGYEGDITLTEPLEMPGLTDPAIVWREGYRRFLEAEYRPDVFEVTQDGAVRVATRGDQVVLSHDVLSSTQWAGRVRAVTGRAVQLDERVTMEAGQSYAIRFREYAEGDTVGTSVVRPVRTVEGETDLLLVEGTDTLPEAGDIVLFGLAGNESYPVIVSRTETTEDQCTVLRAVAAAPEIDTLIDAVEIPAWSSRVGAEIDTNLLAPPTPRFTQVTSRPNGATWEVAFLLEPGEGKVITAQYRIGTRLGSSGTFAEVDIPAANGGGAVGSFSVDDVVEIRAQAISPAGTLSPVTPTITLVIGAGEAAIPDALDAEAITITTLLGGAFIQVATGDDEALARVQIYRSTSAILDRDTDAVGAPYPVDPLQSYSLALGDTTRTNLLTNSGFTDATDWVLDAGWAVASGVATHTPGTADEIAQANTPDAGKWYRVGITVAGRSAGSVTPRFTGGSDRAGSAIAADGDHADRIQTVTGNDSFGFLADSDFDGSIDDAVLYLETAACLSQGTHYVWIEPQNADGVPGPVSGPFTLTII